MLRDACAARGAASVFLRGELANTPEARATVEEAEDAEAAVLGHRSRFLPPLRAVVADVASLDRQARSLVAHLAATAAPAPLLLLANFPRIDQAAAAVATGASAVLAKPFDLDDLIAWVERFGCETPSDSGRQQPSHPDEKHRS